MRPIDEKTLPNLFWPEVILLDGLFLLASEIPKAGVILGQFHDRTDAEAFYNHIHVLDCFDHEADLDSSDSDLGGFDKRHPDFVAACDLGRLVAAVWRTKLMSDFPDQPFRVYFTADDDPVVRFHRVRPDEPAWLDEARWASELADGRVVVFSTDTDASGGAA